MLTLLAVVVAISAFAVIYPYLLYPAILAAFPTRPYSRGAANASTGRSFSLLFCAYNELASMPSKIANLKSLKDRYPELEVLAFDDGSSDGTAGVIQSGAPFVSLVRGSGRQGKAYGMKLLAATARGQFLVFTDANVLLHDDALDKLSACYADANVGGVCGALHYLGGDTSSTATIGGLYWRLEERLKDLESATGSVMGGDGSIFSIRRELYPEFPDTVLDDFTVSMEVVFRGLRLVKADDVIAYERLVSKRSDEYSRRIRIAARAFHTHLTLSDKRKKMTSFNRFKYLSHRTLRWFGGAFLIIGFSAFLTAAALVEPLLGASFLAIFTMVMFYGLRATNGPISSFAEIVLAMVATLIGIFRAATGQTFKIWNPAKSR